jgi:hypothetical protein
LTAGQLSAAIAASSLPAAILGLAASMDPDTGAPLSQPVVEEEVEGEAAQGVAEDEEYGVDPDKIEELLGAATAQAPLRAGLLDDLSFDSSTPYRPPPERMAELGFDDWLAILAQFRCSLENLKVSAFVRIIERRIQS